MSMTLPEIAALTEDNMHTQAYIQGCLYLGMTEEGYMVTSLRRIEARHFHVGHLTQADNKNRYALYKDMMNMAKLSLGEGEFKEFYHCF